MQAAMDVGVFSAERLVHAVQHGERLLRRCCVVEIDQRLAVDLHRQRREILPELCDIELSTGDGRMDGLVHGHRTRSLSQRSAAEKAASRSFSSTMDSIASPTNA